MERGIGPSSTDARPRRPRDVLRRTVIRGRAALGPDPAAADVLAWAAREFGSRLAVASSMTDAVLAHLASQALPGVDVLFTDTGFHFAETLSYRDEIAALLPVTVCSITARASVAEQDRAHGRRLHDRDPDLCCRLRKVEPLNATLGRYEAWATGLRRVDDPGRSDVRAIDWDHARGMVKLNPIAAWTDEDVADHVARHGLTDNPLRARGYLSIGCAPCTSPVRMGKHPRAGRWSGRAKTECGLHAKAPQ